jgi:DNA helicase HerA-like ATPase
MANTNPSTKVIKPQPLDQTARVILGDPDEAGDIAASLQFTETLPFMLVSLLERRYLSDFQLQNWHIAAREEDNSRPLLREVVRIGRPGRPEDWARAMPHVLTACHDPGHALVLALHGQGNHHRLYLGARRIIGAGARSTEDYLEGQESAFKAYFAGLQMGPLMPVDAENMPEMSYFLQTAPSLAVITGIPSGRGGLLPLELQSLDRLVKAVGSQRYVLLVVAEPLEPWQIDQTLDICRRLKSEVHAYTRRTISRTRGESEGIAHTEQEKMDDRTGRLPIQLFSLAAFCSIAGIVPHLAVLGAVAQAASSMAFRANTLTMREQAINARQLSSGKNWSESGSMELLNANAEACEALLQQHIERLQRGRSSGWWRTAVYVAAESEAAVHAVSSAVRSLCGGDNTALDPMRTIFLPEQTLRSAIERGQILSLRPIAGNHNHPLGEPFDALATCINAEELAVLVNLPQHEIPGLPMRDLTDFALSAPSATDDSILLGSLRDSLDHDLGPVTITAAALNRHVFVTGLTGYGKTNTCMQILLEAYNKLGLPFLVLEPAKAEYRRLAQAPELAGKLRIYSVGGNSPLPFRLNPLSAVPGIPLGRHIDLLKAVFNASFPMFAGMPYILEEAILEVYAERGWSLYTSENTWLGPRATLDERSALTPSLEDLHDKIEVVLARKKYGQEIHQNMGAALRSRLRSLMVGNKGLMLNTRRSIPLEDLFQGPTVIELQNLDDDEEKAFVMAVLFVLLYEYAEVRQHDLPPSRREKLQHLTLIEEAHRLLQATHGPINPEVGDPRAKAVSMFTDMLAEMRAYGEGFIIADQIPTKLAPETLKNSNLKIVHRLVAPDDRLAAGSCINLTEAQMRHLNNLAPGQAIVHDERIGEAVLVHIYPAKEMHAPVLADNLIGTPSSGTSNKAYLYRHAGCRSCPAPCTFYHQLVENPGQEEPGQSLDLFLEKVLLDNADVAWQEWTCWLSQRQMNYAALPHMQNGTAAGIAYCAAAQAAYSWLNWLLLARGQAMQKNARLTPADRLRREQAARALSKLFIVWVQKAELDEEARAIFDEVRQELLRIVADAPPRELPECQQCPARCRVLPFVAPHLAKLEKEHAIAAKLSMNISAEACLEMIQRTAEQQIPILARRKVKTEAGHSLLYCLLTHTNAPESAMARREEMLAVLRQRCP